MIINKLVMIVVFSTICLQVHASNFENDFEKKVAIKVAQLASILHTNNAAKLTCQQASQLVLGKGFEDCLDTCDKGLRVTGKIYLNRSLERKDRENRIKDVTVLARLLNVKKAIADLEEQGE